MAKPKREDFEYPDALDDSAKERFDVFSSLVENLQETVGPDASADLDEKDPYADALSMLLTAVDGSPLKQADKKFLTSRAGREVLESAAERIVGSYFRRLSR